ncbi:hypothetical protein AG1IA_05398 [Rhizoctonia solani AG-1 IA]|uniref:Uncharacterized protein n=1 Tax=Thanatephorus cucumeris (strain AG1-IA) TaxID=983506 RepID=L8WUV1_THACA|nr:hypothetical protein AG1IA_05398 [Rhizoctonia solani AG-1 IA]
MFPSFKPTIDKPLNRFSELVNICRDPAFFGKRQRNRSVRRSDLNNWASPCCERITTIGMRCGFEILSLPVANETPASVGITLMASDMLTHPQVVDIITAPSNDAGIFMSIEPFVVLAKIRRGCSGGAC